MRTSSNGGRLASRPRYREPPRRPLDDRLVVGDCSRNLGKHVVHEVVVAGSPSVVRHRRRGFQLDAHLADVAATAVPQRRRLERDPPRRAFVADRPAFGEHEGSVSYERDVLCHLCPRRFVDAAGPGKVCGLTEHVEEVVPRLGEANLERPRVRRARADPGEPSRGLHFVLHHLCEGEREVVCDRLAVAPASFAAEREPVRQTVVRDGETLGEIRLDLEVAPDGDEPTEQVDRDQSAKSLPAMPGAVASTGQLAGAAQLTRSLGSFRRARGGGRANASVSASLAARKSNAR